MKSKVEIKIIAIEVMSYILISGKWEELDVSPVGKYHKIDLFDFIEGKMVNIGVGYFLKN